jgi:hypothetical protein
MESGSIVIIGTLLAGLFTLIASLHKERAKIWRACIFVGILIGAYGGWETLKLQKTQKEVQQNFQTERLNYERELRVKAGEIAELNREIIKQVTGGDSFAFLEFQITPKTNDAMVYLWCRGKYPCFDVFVTVMDQDETGERMRRLGLRGVRRLDLRGGSVITNQQMREAYKLKAKITMPTLRPETGMRVQDEWQLPANKDSVIYTVEIATRNGNFSQIFKLRRVNGSWKQASQVVKYSYLRDGKLKHDLLNQLIDHDFPPKEIDFAW